MPLWYSVLLPLWSAGNDDNTDAAAEPSIKAVKPGMSAEASTFPYFPFRYVPRSCPVQRLAQMEVLFSPHFLCMDSPPAARAAGAAGGH